jgi:hypothetical protein
MEVAPCWWNRDLETRNFMNVTYNGMKDDGMKKEGFKVEWVGWKVGGRR